MTFYTTAAATSFDVTTARGALLSGETFWLKIDNEIMKVEANTSGALTKSPAASKAPPQHRTSRQRRHTKSSARE